MRYLPESPLAGPDPDTFRNPGPQYRPAMMWIWNDDVDLATLREQVADFAAKGVGGFFIHPMPDAFRKRDFVEGIKAPYPGEEFFRWVKAAAEAAREHGLYCWLYDEGGWPSGTLVGTLAKERPQIAGRVLRVQVLPADGQPGGLPGEEVAVVPAGDGSRLRFYESREGYPTDLMNPATTDAFLASTHEPYRACLGDDFGGLVPGIFTDEACVGGRIGTDRVPWTPALPDVFRARKGYDLLPHLPALFGGTAPQIPRDRGAWGAAGTAPPPPRDRGAWGAVPSAEQAARVRYDFGDVWTQLHADAFYGRTHEWCREHGLFFVGHVGGEDDLMHHAAGGFGHFFRIMRHLDVPGVDVIWRQMSPGQPHLHFSKYAGSAAHLEGKPLALTETFAAYGYGMTYAQMKWVTDRQYADGINLMAPMAAHYASSRGRAFCTMSNLAWGNPQWPLFKEYSDYVGRLSYLLRLGRPSAQVAVFYPGSSLWVESDPAIAESFHAVTDLLQEAQIDFDYIDEDTLAGCQIADCGLQIARPGDAVVGAGSEAGGARGAGDSGFGRGEGSPDAHVAADGALRVGEQTYRVVIVPRTLALPWAVVERLREMHDAGGVVLAVDALPWLCPDAGRQPAFADALDALFAGGSPRARFLSPQERHGLPAVVRALIQPDLSLAEANAHIRYCHRVLPEGHLYFVVNTAEDSQHLVLDVAGAGSAQVWDPDRGTVSALAAKSAAGRTRAQMNLPPLGALFVLVGDGLAVGSAGQPEGIRAAEQPAIPLDGWHQAPLRICRLVNGEPHEETIPLGCEAWVPADLRPWAELGLAEFSGSIAYRCLLDLPEDVGRPALLDLGDVKYAAEVWVNGRRVGARVWSPYTLDVAAFLCAGRNEIRVVVTNTWSNQFLRPDEIAAAKERDWYNTYAQRVEPFQRESLESGLLGPVHLFLG